MQVPHVDVLIWDLDIVLCSLGSVLSCPNSAMLLCCRLYSLVKMCWSALQHQCRQMASLPHRSIMLILSWWQWCCIYIMHCHIICWMSFKPVLLFLHVLMIFQFKLPFVLSPWISGCAESTLHYHCNDDVIAKCCASCCHVKLPSACVASNTRITAIPSIPSMMSWLNA